MSLEDRIEEILCGVLPGDNQTGNGVETLGLAVAGLDPLGWAALRLRYLGDTSDLELLHASLAGAALASPYEAVRKRADPLARLTLAEEAAPAVVNLDYAWIILGVSRARYYSRLRPAHLNLRACLDSWARRGIGRIAARLRG